MVKLKAQNLYLGLLLTYGLTFFHLTLAAEDYTSTITLNNGGCSGFVFDATDSKFSYTAKINSISEPTCFGNVSFKSIKCSKASSLETSVCQKIFSTGPSDALTVVNNDTVNESFDHDNVCANHKKGYFYVESHCNSTTQVSMTFHQDNYQGTLCATIAGHHLSGWAIAIVTVAVILAILIIGWFFWCCCCKPCC